jgi:5'-nucleotidase
VAPDSQRSECGHGVSTGRPLSVDRVGEDSWAASGTPVDCVRFALAHLCPDVDLVFSGINAGANLGTDLLVSGTFAAAREAHIRGVAAIAISHYRRPEIPHTWDHAPIWLADIIRELISRPTTDRHPLWNINLPAIPPTQRPEAVFCPIDRTPIPVAYLPAESDAPTAIIGEAVNGQAEVKIDRFRVTSDFHNRPRSAGSDVDVCFGGRISISHLESF